MLECGELGAPAHGEVEQLVQQRPAERFALGSSLYLDEGALARAHDVHVRVGADVLGVLEVEARLAVDDADADRGNRPAQRLTCQ